MIRRHTAPVLRPVVATCACVALAGLVPATPAHAASATPGAASSAAAPGSSPQVRYRLGPSGRYTISFSRAETAKIAHGARPCAAIVEHVPAIGTYLATACRRLSVVAAYAEATDRCVRVRGRGLARPPRIEPYTGSGCR